MSKPNFFEQELTEKLRMVAEWGYDWGVLGKPPPFEKLERPCQQILNIIDEQIEYRGAGVFYVKPPLFRALRDNRKTPSGNFCTTPRAKREAADE